MVAGLLIESRAMQKLKKKKKCILDPGRPQGHVLGVVFIRDDILQSPGELKQLITKR